MGFEHQPIWGTICFMDTLTRILECILFIFEWVFMAILIGFEHQEYRRVYYANLNAI